MVASAFVAETFRKIARTDKTWIVINDEPRSGNPNGAMSR